ncbi:MAG: amino acid adenylation domain-containing protein, partial [Candidatus Aminicenantes bacterium]
MKLGALIKNLKELQIDIRLIDNRLKVNAPKGVLTPALLSELKERKKEILDFLGNIREHSDFQEIFPVEKKEYYDVSHAQKRLWLLDQLTEGGGSVTYNMPFSLLLEGTLCLASLNQSLNMLIERHESLRTTFISLEGSPRQIIHQSIKVTIDETDLTKAVDKDELAREYAEQHAATEFDLTTGPLLNVRLLKLDKKKHICLLNIHHIVCDGWSVNNVLVKELFLLYNPYFPGKENPLSPLKIHYKEFAVWQNTLLQAPHSGQLKDFWHEQLSGELPLLNLPADYRRPVIKTDKGDALQFTLESRLTSGIKGICKAHECSLFMVLAALVTILLHRYTSCEDIITGIPTAGRNHVDLENQVGFYVNTLVLRNRVKGEQPFNYLLEKVKKSVIEAFDHQFYPFNKLVEDLSLNRDMSRNPLFDVMIVLQNTEQSELQAEGIKISRLVTAAKISKFDLTFNFIEIGEGLCLKIEYSTELFLESRLHRMRQHFIRMVTQVISFTGIKVKDIDLLTPGERKQVLHELNTPFKRYPGIKTLHESFTDCAKKNPEQTAVIYRDNFMTYRELDKRANAAACELRQKGAVPDTIVGLMKERSLEMITGIMGILKSGAAYLPIDPALPLKRTRFMLEDSQVDILLTREDLAKEISNDIRQRFCYLEGKVFPRGSVSNLEVTNQVYDLAYIIYTSGTTGNPKAVAMEHRSVVGFVTALWEKIGQEFGPGTRFAMFSPYYFDGSVQQIFPALLLGNALVIIPDEIRYDADLLITLYNKNRIDILDGSPILMNLLKDSYRGMAGKNRKCLVKNFLISTDILPRQLAREFLDMFVPHKPTITNVFGVTECCVDQVVYPIDYEKLHQNDSIPIGTPLGNSQIYILDKYSQLTPIGVLGELCISGGGLGRGYLNRVELTAEKFVNNPFVPGRLMYRTGDLARWLPDGNLDLLGRLDHQVKIRGFRIELGEIQTHLTGISHINQAVVLARSDERDRKYLCAYIVSDKKYLPSELRLILARDLPEYMIPSYFVRLDHIPLTPNGKINRKALPPPEIKAGRTHIPPGNPMEKKLVETWARVLNIDKEVISIDSNFFALGGHSLKATLLASRIHKKFNVKIPLVEIFKTPDIIGLSKYISRADKNKCISIKASEKKEYYAPSSAQIRLYLLQQITPTGTVYNMPKIVSLGQYIDKEKLEEAFKKLVHRHESLRTSFAMMMDREPVQRVHERVEFEIQYDDIPGGEVEAKVHQFIRPFDLSKAPLFRAGLISTGNNYILITDLHHIISDGTSQQVLIKEFAALYAGKKLQRLKLQYKDYAVWRNSYGQQLLIKQRGEYWLHLFSSGEIPVLDLPLDYPRPAEQSFEGSSERFVLTREKTRALNEIAEKSGATLYIVVLAVFAVLLWRLSGQEDIIVGTPVAARNHADLEYLIGMLVNTLAMRNYPSGNKTFKEFLEEVKENALKAFENEDYPFEELVEKLEVQRDIRRNPLFDVFFVLQNMEVEEVDLEGFNPQPYKFENKISKFDITLSALEREGKITFDLEYSTKLFKRETIERWIRYFENIVEVAAGNWEIKLNEIEICTEAERHRILFDFNNTRADFPKDKAIHELFVEQAERTPGETALIFAGKKIDYRQLNKKTGELAAFLRHKGVKAGTVVGIMTERSLAMLVGIIGILKSGGAYLPLALEYPAERIKYMLADSGAQLVLTKKQKVVDWEDNWEFIDLGDAHLYGSEGNDGENAGKVVTPHDPAYIIYTSGSTGRPKGVMIRHRSVLNRLTWMQKAYPLGVGDVVLQKTPIVFDVSVWELFWWSFTGAALDILGPGDEKNPEEILRSIEKNKVTILHFVPSMLNSFFQFLENFGDLYNPAGLRLVFTSGEELEVHQVKKFDRLLSQRYGVRLVNLYGPTEAAVDVSFYNIHPGEKHWKIPIGKPIHNTSLYVLHGDLNVQPVGVPGELYIGGVGLAVGYLNNPGLTAEKFIDAEQKIAFPNGHLSRNPKHSKLYKTGDRARWLPDGNIEFLGRLDHQVKIRGFRIELKEIENRLLRVKYIKEAVVIDRLDEMGQRYLCAYLVSGEKYKISELKSILTKDLPEYMIPSYFERLDKIPLTPNGKIDRKALPPPQLKPGENHTAPRDQIEKKLVEIWAEVLNIDKEVISIDSNFFALGGHSLKATRLALKIHKEFSVRIPLVEIFKTPNIIGLAGFINRAAKDKYVSIKSTEKKEYYVLSSAQKRLYILHRIAPESTGYNMPKVVYLDKHIDKEKLENTFKILIQRHESLRTSFQVINEIPAQRIRDRVEFAIDYFEVKETGNQKIIENFIKPFDLSKAPLLRAGLIISMNNNILIMDLHHIISDGTSQQVLTKEFALLYGGKELPGLRLQYKDYAEWYHRDKQQKLVKLQERYWIKLFPGELPALNLPTDYPRPAEQSFAGRTVSFVLTEGKTRVLKAVAKEVNATLYMAILAVFNILLAKLCGQEDIIVGTPVAARKNADMRHVTGMFVNTLAMRNYPLGNKTFKEFLQEVKENALKAFENQNYPFEELVEKLNIKRDISRNPLFDIMFALQNIDVEKPDQGGLKPLPYKFENKTSKFDITLNAFETGETITFDWEYCTKLFKRETIERWTAYFEHIIDVLSRKENREIKLEEIEILTQPEKNQLLFAFNNTKTDYPKHKTIHELFQEQSYRKPDNTALVSRDKKLSYKELNKKSNQLAEGLKERGVKADLIVGIMMEGSVEMIIGILGILKAGSAYLPIDREYPGERIKYMLTDSGAKILVTTRELSKEIQFEKEIIYLSDAINRVPTSHLLPFHSSNPPSYHLHVQPWVNAPATSLAYVIYTSGSTGKPRGVLVEHSSVINLAFSQKKYFNIDENERILQFSSICFDASVEQIFIAFFSGSALVLILKDILLDSAKFEEFIAKHLVTHLHAVPSFLDNMELKSKYGLKRIISGGDVCPVSLAKQWNRDCRFYNEYGPTETTVTSIELLVDELDESPVRLPIGKCIDNTFAYLLDRCIRPVPLGITGEIYIGGEGVARGYLNNPELSRDKFLINPFRQGERLYRTGDMGRRLPEGNIEFLGRIDHQV